MMIIKWTSTDQGQWDASWTCGQWSLPLHEGLSSDVVRCPRRTGQPPGHQTQPASCVTSKTATDITDIMATATNSHNHSWFGSDTV